MPHIKGNAHGDGGNAGGGGGGGGEGFDFSKDFITDQTWLRTYQLLAGASWGFDVAEGLGNAGGGSSTVVIFAGSSADMVAEAYFKAPNAVLHCGVLVRTTGFNTPDANYYWARLTGGQSRIAKTVAGVTGTVTADQAFAHDADDIIRVRISVVGSNLSAEFENVTQESLLTHSGSDTDIVGVGVPGFRTGFTASEIWLRSVTASSV